jgi:hypothetical protein
MHEPLFIEPWWLMVLVAIALWVLWIALVLNFRAKIDNYFAMRRHNRRMRNYMKRSAQLDIARKLVTSDTRTRR